MVHRGHVKNGVVVLDEPVPLPEGAEVRVEIVEGTSVAREPQPPATLYDRLKPVLGKAKGLPPDAAQNVDHYLYGHPKQ